MRSYDRPSKLSVLALSVVILFLGLAASPCFAAKVKAASGPVLANDHSGNGILSNDTWVDMNPQVKPNPRNNHGFIYDSIIDMFVLVGGFDDVTKYNDTWLYDYANNTWKNMFPVKRPPALTSVSMAYDLYSNQIVLFGGYDGVKYINETWSYSFANNNWTNMKPVAAPSARYGHAMEYDSNHDRIILFGGSDGTKNLNDTWAYDYDANNWTNLSSGVGPSTRRASMMSYDSYSDRIILFGGCISIASSQYFNDTWTFDYDNKLWTNVTSSTAPSARIGPGMTYDVRADRVVQFGGYGKGGGNDETWTYDLNAKLWTKMNPSTRPSLRWGNPIAYNDKRNVVVFFGGYDFSVKGDTWAYVLEKYPSILGTAPINGAIGVPVATTIDVAFNQEMNISYTESAVTSSPTITGSFTWNHYKTAFKWNPSVNLNYSTKYTITIAASAKSKLGIAMQTSYVFSFNTTGPLPDTYPPYVVSTSPTNGTTNISVVSNITIQWNESMNQTSAEGAFSSSPVITCIWSWNNVNQTCTPSTSLQSDTNYTITVRNTSRDVSGNMMKGQYLFSFTTILVGIPPVVISTHPINGGVLPNLRENITITFSERMDKAATEGAISFSPIIPGKYSWNLNTDIITLYPNSNLNVGQYSVNISTAARSQIGIYMVKPYTFIFKVDWVEPSPPEIKTTNPANTTENISMNTNILITFSRAMNRISTEIAISSVPAITGTFSWDTPAKVLTWNPTLELLPSTKYTITFSTVAMSQDGINMQNAYVFSFTTEIHPIIVSTSPSNGENNVEKIVQVIITFSEQMNRGATEGAIAINPGLITNKDWDSTGKVITLNVSLDVSTSYTVRILTGAKAITGHAMLSEYTFSFTTKSDNIFGSINILVLSALSLIVIVAILVILTLLLLKKKKERCPECNEPIPNDVILCPLCGYDFIRKTKRSIAEKDDSERLQPEPTEATTKTTVEVDEESATSRKEALEKIKQRRKQGKK